jgi:hypothetical protein
VLNESRGYGEVDAQLDRGFVVEVRVENLVLVKVLEVMFLEVVDLCLWDFDLLVTDQLDGVVG